MTDSEPCGWGAPCSPTPDAEVQIAGSHGSRTSRPAFPFGSWAVHRSVPVDGLPAVSADSWAVSHAPSGRSIGLAIELEFWDAIRVARALHDTGLFSGASLECDLDDVCIMQAAVGAALHDHYVWPLPGVGANG